MEWVKEYAILLGRIVTILPLMLGVTLFMGRRSIGELPVFDFLIILALGAVAGADIAEPDIKHMPTAIALVLIGLLQKAVSYLKIKSHWFGRLLTFEPIVVIKDGKFIEKHLKQIQYSVDNVLLMLREKDIFDIRTVQAAIIEGNGSLTVMEYPEAKETPAQLTYPVIVDGKLHQKVLDYVGLSKEKLLQELRKKSLTVQDVFFAAVDDDQQLSVTTKKERFSQIPPVLH